MALDADRYARLQDLAERRRTTVPALVRQAIDATFPDVDAGRRREAGRFLLGAPDMDVPADWTLELTTRAPGGCGG